MNKTILAIATLISVSAFAQTKAQIISKDEQTTYVVSLDEKNTPRINGDLKTYPTIKDYRDDADYLSFCYSGNIIESKTLLEKLVYAAHGDGDSWAHLISVKANKNKTIRVVVSITDESGEKEETYDFRPCK
jgi:hypothetical protein